MIRKFFGKMYVWARNFMDEHSYGIRLSYVSLFFILLLLPGCGGNSITGEDTSTVEQIRPTVFYTDTVSASISTNTSWGIGVRTFVEGDSINARHVYTVNNSRLVLVVRGQYTRGKEREYSPATGAPGYWYDEVLYVYPLGGTGKVTITISPPSSPWKKYRVEFTITPASEIIGG